jgi:hypothetical protein
MWGDVTLTVTEKALVSIAGEHKGSHYFRGNVSIRKI